ncbi:c-type cytochrome biogenesis protein CcmI [Rhizobium sp. TH2]|uniref:c-type cytochrome biogenesis protein CcmI n=1 Tax=Rhizobium sp. TH2 TaxID=2775403 RepID=UPI0021588D63|nr:c-type cytochrome biogenesis protein CcmI [Rhizobium sp. TH2]UVC10364.1 c-type cytochrome biogenesis protein CcmI [Rhizobium sp. TH2]
MFWILAISIALVAALLIASPLLRRGEEDVTARPNDAEVYRDQLSEIESDEKSGLIDGESAGQARAEIARRLIAASQDAPRKSSLLRRRQAVMLAVVLCLVVPAGAVALYSHAGLPDEPDFPLRARFESPQPDSNILIRRVELRLEEHPEDGRGWEILAPVYLKRGQVAESVNAWRNAIKYLGADARRYGGLAETLVVSSKGRVDVEARDAFTKILELVPGDPRARFYLALAEAQDGKADAAIAALEALKKASDPAAPWMEVTDAQIERIRAEKEQAAKAPGHPTQDDVAAAADMSDEDRTQMIRTMVESLDARLADDPQNFEGWKRLLRSYVMLQDPAKATEALKRALAAFPADSDNGKALISDAKELGISLEGVTE